MDSSKRPALVALARVLADAATPYAIIGGIALQVHRTEPRTTIDIDLAVEFLDAIPRPELQAAGFRQTGRFSNSENWVAGDGVPIRFTDDPALSLTLARAVEIQIDGIPLRVLGRTDLLHEKLRAGSDPAQRRSERLQDLADAEALLEDFRRLDSPLYPDGLIELLEGRL